MTTSRPTAVSPAPETAALAWARAVLATVRPVPVAGDRRGEATARGFVELARRAPGVRAVSWWRSAEPGSLFTVSVRSQSGRLMHFFLAGRPGAPAIVGAKLIASEDLTDSALVCAMRAEARRCRKTDPELSADLEAWAIAHEEPPTERVPLIPANDPAVEHVNNSDKAIVINREGASVHEYVGGDHLNPQPLAWFRSVDEARRWVR